MPEAVAELLAVAGGVDHLARDGVDLPARSGPARTASSAASLRAQHERRRPRGASASISPVANVRVQSEQ